MQLNKKEILKEIKGYEGIYSITSFGRVWSHRRKKWLKQNNNGHGYSIVTFSVNNDRNDRKVHRLVADAFIENPDNKPQVNHKNGIKSDNCLSNLEWVTRRENQQHACDNNLNLRFKLSYDTKILICRIYRTFNVRQNRLADHFKVAPSNISYIIKTYTPILDSLNL